VERILSRKTPNHRFSSHSNDSLPALAQANCLDCLTAPVAGKLQGSAMDWRIGTDSMAAGFLSVDEG
jgi:hypothetical protein